MCLTLSLWAAVFGAVSPDCLEESAQGVDGASVAQLSGVLFETDDIETYHRVRAKKEPVSIVIQLARQQKRDALLEKAINLRLKNNCSNKSAPSVHVNGHICPTLVCLLRMDVAIKHASGNRNMYGAP